MDSRLEWATKTAIQAALLTEHLRADILKGQGSHSKSEADDDPVTLGDLGAQALILSGLRRSFGKDRVVAEESSASWKAMGAQAREKVGQVLSSLDGPSAQEIEDALDWRGPDSPSGWVWTVDPIDGTKGYRDGHSYTVALGLFRDGKVHGGALLCPELCLEGQESQGAHLFLGQLDEGAWEIPLAFKREGFEDPDQGPRLGLPLESRSFSPCGVGSRANYDAQGPQKALEDLGLRKSDFLVCDSQVKYALVARGQARVYIRPAHASGRKEACWDHLGGEALVRTCGGRVTDMDGKDLDYGQAFGGDGRLNQNRGVLATQGMEHDRALEACHKAGL